MASETAAGIPATLDQLREPIDSMISLRRNARRGDIATIRESLATHGQFRPIVANRPTREVLAGNHTLAAARELGWTEIAVTWVDVDEDAAQRIALVENRSGDLATWDDALLADLLREFDDLGGTGFSKGDLDALIAKMQPPAEWPDPSAGGPEEFQCPSCGYEWSGQPRLNGGE